MEKRDAETNSIIGAAMAVHSELGHGFLEAVYQETLEREFQNVAVPYQREVEIEILYQGEKLNTSYRADFICSEGIIVELKALQSLTTKEEAQVINYLKATGYTRALLINFGSQSPQYKRLVLTNT